MKSKITSMNKLIAMLFFTALSSVASAQQFNPSTGLSGVLSLRFIELGRYLFVGTDGSGIWRSADHGKNWTASNNGLTASPDYSVTEFTRLGNSTLIAATYDHGVFSSVDSGATWVSITHSLPTSPGNNPANDVAANANLIVVSLDGLGTYHTSDLGVNWILDTVGLTIQYTRHLLIVGDTIFAVTQAGLFKSSVTNFSWKPSNNGLGGPISCRKIHNDNDTLYLGTSTNGIYRSTTNGRSWTAINTPAIQGSRVVDIATTDTKIYIATSFQVHESPKNAINWTALSSFDSSTFQLNDVFISGTTLLTATGNDGPYYYSAALSTSIPRNSTEENLSVYPNPSTGIFSLQGETKISTVEVTNALGTIVFAQQTNASKATIDISKESNGVYYVKIISQAGISTEKLILSK
jgi:photosystem II stability/assembly factor-like uncharacterized protein